MLNTVRIWIFLSALLVALGWILSALHELNRIGYGIAFALAAVVLIFWRRKAKLPSQIEFSKLSGKFRNRFKRPAPALFFVLLCLAFISGAFYPPTVGDGMYYRTPRVLHWLAAGQWHWIRTFDIRMNIADCGFEWLTAPLMLFTHTDRLFFLINIVSYLMLPGLVFSVFRRLGVRSNVAWWWMWLLPSGWCYLFQAGTIANDSFAAVYALASVAFALKARESKCVNDLWLSMLAAALLTGGKQTNLPLALLWLIAAMPSLKLFLSRPFSTTVIAVLCLLVSAVPIICLNMLHDCNWAGVPNHPGPDWAPWKNIEIHSPFWGIIGNAFSLTIQNFAPPFFPFYETWNNLMHRFTLASFGSHFSSFESFGSLPSFLGEQTAGLGILICVVALISIFWTLRWRLKNSASINRSTVGWQIRTLRLAPWALLILFMAKVSAWESARQIAPYYPFLLPLFLVRPGVSSLVRRTWWQKLGIASMFITAIVFISSPAHPFWPANAIFNRLARQKPNSGTILRAQSFYSMAQINRDVLRHAFENTLPRNEKVIGYGTFFLGIESRLWHPFDRRVERLLPTDARDDLARRGIHYAVVDESFLKLTDSTFEQLTQRYNARLIDELTLSGGRRHSPQYIYLIQLRDSDMRK